MVLDALMGTADGHREIELFKQNGSRVADYVRDHPDGATGRLFGDGFTIRREATSLPKPPSSGRCGARASLTMTTPRPPSLR